MPDTLRMTPMRGFTASVSRAQVGDAMTHSAVSFGIDRTPGEEAIAIALRHADGTILTTFLDRFQFARMGAILDDFVQGVGEGSSSGIVQ